MKNLRNVLLFITAMALIFNVAFAQNVPRYCNSRIDMNNCESVHFPGCNGCFENCIGSNGAEGCNR